MTEQDMQRIQVPLDDFIREIAKEAARTVIVEHRAACPIGETVKRVDKLSERTSFIFGWMAGSGLLGGAAGATIVKLMGG